MASTISAHSSGTVPSVFVKICGITNEEDALLAVAMGTDAVGFVFAASSRQVSPATARDIARRLPREILTVGVFRDESPQRVVEIVNANGLKGAQLHGHESPNEVAWIRKRVGFVIKAFAAGDRQLERLDEYVADAILVDAAEPGSGQTFDWALARNLPAGVRIIVAGGLGPDNVGDAIERLRPWGVDVSTGVESAPGRKDAIKLMRFVEAARAFDDYEDDEDYDDDLDLTELEAPEVVTYDAAPLPTAPASARSAVEASTLFDFDDE
jgi:phosphoribosylanthranilate isomerase